jgi:hypothetical protein
MQANAMTQMDHELSLGECLVGKGLITMAQLEQALAMQAETLRSLGRVLVEMGWIDEATRMSVLHREFGFQVATLRQAKIDPRILQAIPYVFAEKHRVVPVRVERDGTLVIAMEDPSDLLVVDAIKNQVGQEVLAMVASAQDVQGILNQYQTGCDEQPILTLPARPKSHAPLYVWAKGWAFPLLTWSPLALIFLAIKYDWFNITKQFGAMGIYNMTICLLLAWGLWAVVLFEINGLIFDESSQDER